MIEFFFAWFGQWAPSVTLALVETRVEAISLLVISWFLTGYLTKEMESCTSLVSKHVYACIFPWGFFIWKFLGWCVTTPLEHLLAFLVLVENPCRTCLLFVILESVACNLTFRIEYFNLCYLLSEGFLYMSVDFLVWFTYFKVVFVGG